jgi:hypothetical protein
MSSISRHALRFRRFYGKKLQEKLLFFTRRMPDFGLNDMLLPFNSQVFHYSRLCIGTKITNITDYRDEGFVGWPGTIGKYTRAETIIRDTQSCVVVTGFVGSSMLPC